MDERPVYVFDIGSDGEGTTFCRLCQCAFLSGRERWHELRNPERHAQRAETEALITTA